MSHAWLLPEYFEDILPPYARQVEDLRRRLMDLFESWGYETVCPPLMEYLESLLTGAAQDLDLKTFKVVDGLSGRMLGVRADITPQVARIDAHRLKREVPTRLCYIGTVLHTRPEGLSVTRSPLQVGAELYGHAGLASDLEVIRLMLQTLETCAIPSVYMDLGHVGIFGGLARQAGLSVEQEAALFDMLQRKALPEIGAFVRELSVDAKLARMLGGLAELNGGLEVLELAGERLRDAAPPVHAALDYLRQVVAGVRRHHPQVELHIDLAELRGYHYHTGVVFAAYVPGEGQEIARGGRYDEIGRVFGRARPATGFSTDLKILARMSAAQTPAGGELIFAPGEDDDAALEQRVAELRASGARVVRALAGQAGDARTMGCTRALAKRDNDWTLVDVS